MTDKIGASGLILNEPLLWEKGKKGMRADTEGVAEYLAENSEAL